MPLKGSAPDGSNGPHALVASVHSPTLEADDRHHLQRVLRLRSGDPLTVTDGEGRWAECIFGAQLSRSSDVVTVDPPLPRLGVAFALIKGGRPELVVQKLVELGIDDIWPFTAERSVVKWDDEKVDKNQVRLDRVAREALMQCRRVWRPTIHRVRPFCDVAALQGAAMADRGGSAVSLSNPIVLIGPEGGWSDDERLAELPRVGLAGPVLRAETAAIAAGTLLGALRESSH